MKASTLFAAAVIVAGTSVSSFALEPDPSLTGTVYFMLPNFTTVRFVQKDAPAFVEAMKKYAPNIEVTVVNGESNPAQQQSQAEAAITDGAKAIVLVAADPSLASSILFTAEKAGTPLIAYEHEASGGPVTYYTQFGALKVGQAQGKNAAAALSQGGPYKIARLYGNKGDYYTRATKEGQDEALQPLIDSGQIEVVCEDYVPNWNPSEAQRIMEQCLTKTNADFSAIVASNDGTAEGALAALVSQGLAGQVKILGGQDANVATLQNILLGLQHGTVLKTYSLLADSAARLVVAALHGEDPEPGHINGEFDNGYAKIPTAFIDVTMIDKSNVGDVVDAGVWTWADICTGPAAKTPECEAHTAE
ncbi:MAG: substrate-binding domain-containing protein [Bauldia sp.]|nr:substrate-binding domain-containing protein [Bauldia sp.]